MESTPMLEIDVDVLNISTTDMIFVYHIEEGALACLNIWRL